MLLPTSPNQLLEVERLHMLALVGSKAHVGETLWANEWCRLAVETDGLRIASPVPHFRLVTIGDESARALGDRLAGDLERTRPRWLLLPIEASRAAATPMWVPGELSNYPVRLARFEALLGRIDRLLDRDYILENRSAHFAIWRRVDPTPIVYAGVR